MAGAMLGMGFAHAFTPQAGGWVVTAENNGQPGRGMAIDVQDDTLVMQMYAYEANGSPTFYLTAGKLKDNVYTGAMNKYRNGPAFGGGKPSGQPDGNAGQVKIRFVSGTQGFITFPNEPAEKEITRFNFGYDNSQYSLQGFWMLAAMHPTHPDRDTVDFFKLELNADSSSSGYGTGAMASRDHRYLCEHIVRGANAGNVLCLKFNSNGSATRENWFKLSINLGEGFAGLPYSNLDDELHVKRIVSPSGTLTGNLLKDAQSDMPPGFDPARISSLMRGLAEQPHAASPSRQSTPEPATR